MNSFIKLSKKLVILFFSLLLSLSFYLSTEAKEITLNLTKRTNQGSNRCKIPKPKRKYLASLAVNSFTVCDDLGCETQEGGIISNNLQNNYFLSAIRATNGTYTYYLLDRKTFREYQVPLIPDCGQISFILPISLQPGVADTDTVEMECTGLVDKRGVVLGDCEGSFFSFDVNGDFIIKGPFTLAPTKQTIINPCKTAAGILIYGTQCANR